MSEFEDVDRRFAAVQLTRSWWEPRTCIRHCDFLSLKRKERELKSSTNLENLVNIGHMFSWI